MTNLIEITSEGRGLAVQPIWRSAWSEHRLGRADGHCGRRARGLSIPSSALPQPCCVGCQHPMFHSRNCSEQQCPARDPKAACFMPCCGPARARCTGPQITHKRQRPSFLVACMASHRKVVQRPFSDPESLATISAHGPQRHALRIPEGRGRGGGMWLNRALRSPACHSCRSFMRRGVHRALCRCMPLSNGLGLSLRRAPPSLEHTQQRRLRTICEPFRAQRVRL